MQGGLQCTQQQVGTGLQGFGRSRGGLHCTTAGGDRHAGGVFNAPHQVRAGMQACDP